MNVSIGSLVFMILLNEGLCTGLTSWNMNLFCGTKYVKNIKDTAGEVYFDVASFNGRVEECNLTITPASVDFGGNKVMFYFTTFEFQSACDSMNVSVLDGIGRSASIVQGLPRFICGLNSSLTSYVFSSTGKSLRLQVHVNLQNHWEKFRGHFRLKFISYHTGTCHESFSHQCSNGHCIPYLYNCSDSINACGDVDYNCDDDTMDTVESGIGFGDIIKYVLIVIACICIFHLLKSIGKWAKQKYRNATDCVEDSCCNMRLKCTNCCKTVNLSRLPKPRLPEFIRNRLRPNNPETEDDISTTDAVDNTAFADDESQVEQVQVIMPFPPMTDISQTDIEPPSYEEAMTTSTPSYSYMQPEEPAPLYEDVVSENPTLPAFQSFEHSATPDDIIIYENDSVNQNEATNNTDRQNINSDVLIEPELDTTSILNLYLNDFAVELSDNYSTDSDFDTQSNTTILSAELNSGAHQLQNENGTQNEMCGGDIPTELRADTDSDWSSECASSHLRQEQIDDFRTLNSGCDTQTALRIDSESDWDSQSDSSVLPAEHVSVRQSVQNENDMGSVVSGCDTQTALGIDSESDWDSQSDSLVLPAEHVTVRQSVQNENGMGYVVGGCDTQNVINFSDPISADRDSSTLNEVRDSDEENAPIVSDIRNALSARTGIDSSETHTEASEIDDEHNDMPVSPPNYDEAVPPPYYYDYIANVGRYKQSSFEDSEA
ncbi:uncharacterized protein LOC132725677 [Ruditapes philippinarum]|uniref:uncharacterized protein LOC132725677 n=1 Tax=Ruditapes philippinarum TaxID=129788 RepID=UPI00295C36C4|nr:uncharacterized protein LOC132725677 [Ruditapes philippinarum]